MVSTPDGSTNFDFASLAREAAKEAYDQRAQRCWPWSHAWTMWQADPTQRTQARRCTKCGKHQIKTLRTSCLHVWSEVAKGPIVNLSNETVGHYVHLKCNRCGDVINKDIG